MMVSQYVRGKALYEGKAKSIFSVEGSEDLLWLEYKDSLTAFNAQKKGSFESKGLLNRNIATRIFRYLSESGVLNHWVSSPSERVMICKKLEIIPIEVVVRNRLAGSTAKKFGIEEGQKLESSLVEFYYKDDSLGDPFMSDDQALMMKAAKSADELDELKRQAHLVNHALQNFFSKIGLELIDFKLEFGRLKSASGENKILLGDEISPDSCRLWDMKTGEKMDKDRFRRDLGKVEESYQEVWNRIQKVWGVEAE